MNVTETKLKLSAEATQEIGSVFTMFLYVILFVKKLHWPIVHNYTSWIE